MKEIPLILLGAGGVGRALVQQIVEGRTQTTARNDLRLRVVAVADTRSWRRDAEGLPDTALQEIVQAKKEGRPLGEERPEDGALLQWAQEQGLKTAIVVDVTAAEGLEPLLDGALERGYGVVLANKKPLAGPWQKAQSYYTHPRLRHESTVAGGQPVVATLRTLLDSGDEVVAIEGQLSGTLSYICRRMDDGTRFSVALAGAKALGYTEPDPRQDLSGRDVMRKLLILGRMAGWALEEADIAVEALTPPALAHLDVDEFMLASMALDPSLRDRVDAAGASGEVLRYVAELEGGRGNVGLKPLPVDSPLADLKYVSFRTRRFQEPLIIASNSTGAETTAAGVLGDVIALAREMV